MPKRKFIAIALAIAIGGTVAWPNDRPGPCAASYDPTDWDLEGGQYAPWSCIVQWVFKMICSTVPQSTDPCDFCAVWSVDGWAGDIDGWVVVWGPQSGNLTVACGQWNEQRWSINFNGTIAPGMYLANATLYDGLCLGPKIVLMSDAQEFDIIQY